ncbi:hypothetical protein [Streptomyces ortus]|uniref:Cysteine desulfurase n=1 Tax=Streptomyces ortus TaxID=2867268 RepID=A0ABT3VCP2_9ACTN|nr:hypothetical protein [Streptomyces ortus]MCX4237596.1 hypothetical protein [Streptomyces ortus]
MPASTASPGSSGSSVSPWIAPAVARLRTADPYVVDNAANSTRTASAVSD